MRDVDWRMCLRCMSEGEDGRPMVAPTNASEVQRKMDGLNPLRRCAPAPLERGASGCRLLLERDAPVWEGEDVLEGLVSCGEDFESGLERVVDRLAAGFKDTLGQ